MTYEDIDTMDEAAVKAEILAIFDAAGVTATIGRGEPVRDWCGNTTQDPRKWASNHPTVLECKGDALAVPYKAGFGHAYRWAKNNRSRIRTGVPLNRWDAEIGNPLTRRHGISVDAARAAETMLRLFKPDLVDVLTCVVHDADPDCALQSFDVWWEETGSEVCDPSTQSPPEILAIYEAIQNTTRWFVRTFDTVEVRNRLMELVNEL